MKEKEPIYLQAVKMENAQSHIKTIYEFAPNKINVLAADNGVGKSVFFKMLKATLLPRSLSEQDRYDLIRHGCEYAQITYLFSDGAWGLCRVYLKSIVFNYAAPGAEHAISSYDVPEELISHLNILMDVDSLFITNIIDTKQNLLLVDSNLKSNYQLLKLIACDDTLQELLEKLPIKIEEAKKLNTQLEAKLNYIRQKFDTLSYVDEAKLRYQIQSLEAKTNVLYQSVDCYKLLNSIEILLTDKLDFTKLLKEIDLIEQFTVLDDLSDKIAVQSNFDENKLIETLILEKVLKIKECIYSRKFSCAEFKQSTLDKIILLEKLNNVLSAVQHVKSVDVEKERLFHLLEKLCDLGSELMHLAPTKNGDFRRLTVKINEATKIIMLQKSLTIFESTVKSLAKAERDYNNTVQIIKESNFTVQCGIYGEVVFDGKHCTPVN